VAGSPPSLPLISNFSPLLFSSFLYRTVPTTTTTSRSPLAMSRPVAVLLGWLGCQPKNLRRFVDVYNSRGWDSIIRVASPESVIAAIQEGPGSSQLGSHINMQSRSGYLQPPVLTKDMCLQAFDILHELQSRKCPQYVVHVFSNGGCFLWEWIAHMLVQQHQSIAWNDISVDVRALRDRLIGSIFDSSPANYEGRPIGIVAALQHITPTTEKNRLIEIAKNVDASRVNKRHDEFWNKMTYDRQLGVPELYLYSENDQLAVHKPLQKLIQNREEVVGKENVFAHNFIDSEHCAHLLKYPKQYDFELGKFVAICSSKHTITSKL
jgi:hypothetical protein